MSSENGGGGPATSVEKTSKENVISNNNALGGEGRGAVNGATNGYGDKHSSSREHRSDKEKQREKDKNRDKSRDEKREKERSKDKHSSNGKEKERSSHSSSSKDKDKKHREEKKDRDNKSSTSKDKEQKSSSSSSHRDKDKHGSHDKDKSSTGIKEKHSSSSSNRDKDKDKSKLGTSSDKKPSSSTSSSKDKHRSKEGKDSKDKSKSSTSKDDERHKERKEKVEEKSVPKVVKRNPGDVKVKLEFGGVKSEPIYESEEEIPLALRTPLVKRELEEESEDDMPLSARKKAKKSSSKKRVMTESSESEDDMKPAKKAKKVVKKPATPASNQGSPTKKKKKEEEEEEVWKWWEEEKKEDGVKWKFLEHLGPMFAPEYEPLPPDVKFSYDGKEMKLSVGAEEVATFYAKMIDHDYTTKEVFNKNFFKDWRKVMSEREVEKIKDLKKCNFKQIASYFLAQTEARKAMSKEEKKAIKDKNEEIQKEYGFCLIDGHKEKIGNFRIEPPGLFRGRGEHPKMGMLKKRVVPEQVLINCSKDSKYPKAPPGHKWKEVRHDNTVTWLASWTENVQGQVKYVMLNPSSKLKGEKDWQKYEVARELKKCIGKIRTTYQNDWKAKEMMIRQRAVALYFIDKLALRAGNEKDEDQADTVGCCSLRFEHITLQEELGDMKNVVVFDFLGKDSIRYYNEVSVEKRVFKNLQLFMQNKNSGDDLFDRLNTSIMNKHLSELMPGLSAKVFRTYNASITLQDQLKELTDPNMSVQEKILAYNRANRAVAILCNHQRAVPKTHEKSMGNMKEKISAKEDAVAEAEKAYKNAKRERGDSARNKIELEKKKKAVDRLKEQLAKLKLLATDKEENKDIALGTSKLNYLDPRISVAWCKKFDVPIEKVYNKTQRAKFNWAIDMATKSFVF